MTPSTNAPSTNAPSTNAPSTNAPGAGETFGPPSPPAIRADRRAWKDPRLWVGLVIVAGCMLLGGRLLAGADDTVTVWSAAQDLPAGTAVSTDVLAPAELRFESEDTAGRYLATRHRLPPGGVLEREVSAGELLPRAALTRPRDEELVDVPIAPAGDAVPAELRAGDVVDVWVAPAPTAGGNTGKAEKVLTEVRVTGVARSGRALGPSVTRQVVVGVPADADAALAEALARIAAGEPVLVRRD